jgi:dipeptide/tripeptide permease
MERSKFPPLFWVGNIIEILERFAYYGLYIPFGIYATASLSEGGLAWSKGQLGLVQTLFLVLSYSIPLISGPLADRYGFKNLLIASYLLYLPGFLLLLVTRGYATVFLVMVLIGIAAGVFKPLIAGTVRLTTDETNRTRGFGIFYLMVNVGAFFGPLTVARLRTIHWDYAFIAAAVITVLMLIVTIIFYRDPIEIDREKEKQTAIGSRLAEILRLALQPKVLVFIIIFGVLIEMPFWAFFNIVAMFVDEYVRTDLLYNFFSKYLGVTIVDWFSTHEGGPPRIAGEALAHTALYIMIFQIPVTWTTEKLRSVPTIALGVVVMMLGCIGLFFSVGPNPGIMFLAILLFALGEMACMPRFEQYLISLLPPEKTGLGGGLLRIPIAVGSLSGAVLTPLYGRFEEAGSPETIWLVLAASLFVGFVLTLVYDKVFRHEG